MAIRLGSAWAGSRSASASAEQRELLFELDTGPAGSLFSQQGKVGAPRPDQPAATGQLLRIWGGLKGPGIDSRNWFAAGVWAEASLGLQPRSWA